MKFLQRERMYRIGNAAPDSSLILPQLTENQKVEYGQAHAADYAC
jgi:hypothetical protein